MREKLSVQPSGGKKQGIVPITIKRSPAAPGLESLSLNTMRENAIEIRILSLSMGTTTLARPICRALK